MKLLHSLVTLTLIFCLFTLQTQEVWAQSNPTVRPVPEHMKIPDSCVDKAPQCYVAAMEGKDADTAMRWISYISALALAFLVPVITRSCLQSLKVPSVVLFAAATAVFLSQEIILSFIFKAEGQDVLEIDYKKTKENYDVQLQKFEDLKKILEEGSKVTYAKAALQMVTYVGIMGAISAALIEGVTLEVAIFKHNVAVKKLAISKTESEAHVPLLKPVPEASGMSASSVPISASANTLNVTNITIPIQGKSVTEGEVESKNDDVTVGTATTINGANTANSAALETSYLAALAALAPSLANPITAIKAGLKKGIITKANLSFKALGATMINKFREMLTLKSIKSHTLVTCSKPITSEPSVTHNLTTPLAPMNFQLLLEHLLMPSAWAAGEGGQAETIANYLKPLGIVGAAGIAFFLAKSNFFKGKAEYFLFHPFTRAGFFLLISGLFATLASYTFWGAKKLEDRVAHVDKLIYELKRVKAVSNMVGGKLATQNELLLPELPPLLPREADSKLTSLKKTACLKSGNTIDPNCECKKNNSCFKPSTNLQMESGFSFGQSFSDKLTNLPHSLNQLTQSLSSGDMSSSGKLTATILGQSQAFKQELLDAIAEVEEIDEEGSIMSEMNQNLKDELLSFGQYGKSLGKQYPQFASELKELDSLGNWGEKNDENSSPALASVSPNPIDTSSHYQPNFDTGYDSDKRKRGKGRGKDIDMEIENESLITDPNSDEVKDDLQGLKFKNIDISTDQNVSIFELLNRRYRKYYKQFMERK